MTSFPASDPDLFTSFTLTCSICFDLFEGDPRVLPCGHTNCTRCLEQLRLIDDEVIKCPQCQWICPFPVDQLPVNFVAKQLVELRKRTDNKSIQSTEEWKKRMNELLMWKDEAEKRIKHLEEETNCAKNGNQAMFCFRMPLIVGLLLTFLMIGGTLLLTFINGSPLPAADENGNITTVEEGFVASTGSITEEVYEEHNQQQTLLQFLGGFVEFGLALTIGMLIARICIGMERKKSEEKEMEPKNEDSENEQRNEDDAL